MSKQKVSALIITLNEEKHISQCLDSISFADEIIVVDSFSTDQTEELVRKYPHVCFMQHPFKNYTLQRNFTLDQATYDWVFFLDADEQVPQELAEEVLKTINSEDAADAYLCYRSFRFKGKPLRYSGMQTDRVHRLFRKSKCRYSADRIVHEIINVDGTTKTLKNAIIHHAYSNYHEYKQKKIKYGRMKALEEKWKGIKPNFYHFYIRPAWKFFHNYILRLGLLDGRKGFIICYLGALGVVERYKELRRLWRS